MNQIPDIPAQLAAVDEFFGLLAEADARLRYEADAHPDAQADYPQELAA
jgi:tRNA-dihydrouridine synthase B